jgi:hypothetical protein
MNFPEEQIEEFKSIFGNIQKAEEGGVIYFFIPSLILPDGCTPSMVDALLCPTPRDGYKSRLFFSERILTPVNRNWNAQNVRILERNWHAFSWQTKNDLRLAQMVTVHLRGLK